MEKNFLPFSKKTKKKKVINVIKKKHREREKEGEREI